MWRNWRFQNCRRHIVVWRGRTRKQYGSCQQGMKIRFLLQKLTYLLDMANSIPFQKTIFPPTWAQIFKLLRSPWTNSARLCSLAGLYDNPIPTRFPASIECSKIPAPFSSPEGATQQPGSPYPTIEDRSSTGLKPDKFFKEYWILYCWWYHFLGQDQKYEF
jgi:hypothetical protein